MEQTVRSFFVVCTVPPSIGDKLKRRQYRRIEKGILEFSNKSSSWHSVNTTKGLTFLFQAISLMQIASKPTTDASTATLCFSLHDTVQATWRNNGTVVT